MRHDASYSPCTARRGADEGDRLKWLCRPALWSLLTLLASPVLAEGPPPGWEPSIPPQTFVFTGVISNTTKIDNSDEPAPTAVPDSWLGQSITGRLRVVPNRAEGGDGVYGTEWNDGNPEFGRSGSWMSIAITQPDGSIFSAPADPTLPMGTPDHTARLIANNGWPAAGPGRQTLAIRHNFDDGVTEQAFSLDLASALSDEWDQGLVSFPLPDNGGESIPYISRLAVDASKATWTNSGVVGQDGPNGLFSYGFRLTSFDHLPPVPEPETWAMLLLGVGAVGAVARRRRATG